MKVGAERMRGALVDGGNQRIVARVVMHGDWFCTASGRGSGRWSRHRPTVGWLFSQRRFHLELFYYTMQRSHGGHWPGMVYTVDSLYMVFSNNVNVTSCGCPNRPKLHTMQVKMMSE